MDLVLSDIEIIALTTQPHDLASSPQARVHCMLEERLGHDVTHAAFERILIATILKLYEYNISPPDFQA